MTEMPVPKKKIGVFAPRAIVEVGPYEFYQMAPKGIMLVIVPMGIRNFTREGVEEVYAGIDEQLNRLRPEVLRFCELSLQNMPAALLGRSAPLAAP